MNRRLCIPVLVALVLTPLAGIAGPFWQLDELITNPGQCDWFAVSAATDARAWAVGRDGRFAMKRSGSTFGSYDWVGYNLPTDNLRYQLYDVFVLPTDTAYVWLVGEDTDHHTGVIVYTQNGGGTWYTPAPLTESSDSLSPFYAVSFADQYKGYIGAGNGIIMRTDDGGANWTRLDASGTWSSADCFVDIWTKPGTGDTVWALSDNNSEILKSANGGSNWSLYTGNVLNKTYSIPGVGNHPGRFVTFDVSFPTGDSGAIALSHGKIAKSTDFGSNWNVSTPESSATWFEACDYGSNDTLYLVARRGVIRSEPGKMEYMTGPPTGMDDGFHFRDIDMVGDTARGFAVGDWGNGVGATSRRKCRRYDPARFEFDSLYVAYPNNCDYPCTLVATWHTKFERNTNEWCYAMDCEPIVRNPGYNFIPTGTGLYAAEYSNDSLEYVFRKALPQYKNVKYYFSVYLKTNDDTNYPYLYCGGPYEVVVGIVCDGWGTARVPDPPRNVEAQDESNDQGRTIQLNWDPPADTSGLRGYLIGRSLSEDGPFFLLFDYQSSTAFDDEHVVPGNEYHYVVCSTGSLDIGGVDYQVSDTVLVSAIPIDDVAPSPVPSFTHDFQERDETGDSIRIRFTWEEDTDDSTVCGYWFCPIDNQITTRTVVHKAPIQRNWYMLKGTWKSGESIIAGVLPMDCSGNMASSAWKDDTLFVANYQTAHWNATGHNNANRIAQSPDEDLHFGFTSSINDTDVVYYQTSTDDGADWTTPARVGRGRDPCLCLMTGGTPYMIWRMTEPSGGNLTGKLYFSKKQQGGWSTPSELYSTTAPGFAVGSPSAVTAGSMANITWEARKVIGGIGYADIVFVGYLDLNSASPQLTYEGIDTVWSGGAASDSTEVTPSIDVDLSGLPHVAWRKDNDIYYAGKGPSGWPPTYQNITGTSSNESRNAHIDLQGDWIRVVWEEEHAPSTGYYDVSVWSHWKTASLGSARKSTISSNCLEPVIDGNFILWSEKVGSYYEVFVCPYDYETYGWCDSSNISGYPFGDSRYPQVITEVVQCYQEPEIFCVWTEGSAGYWTMNQKKTFSKKQPYYPHDLGLETQSPLTVARDGYISYGASTYKTVDYDADTLKYQCNLDSAYNYTLELTYYHEGDSARSYELLIDGIAVDTSLVSTEQKVTVEASVPDSAVQDGQIAIQVRSPGRDTVTCGDFLLFQSSPGGGGGGGQAFAHRRSGPLPSPMLMAPCPNPSVGRPVIEYFLPDERHARVQVFDVSGRLVESIASGEQKAGWHRVVWNTDDNGAGVYFCRMNAGDVQMTRKLILVR